MRSAFNGQVRKDALITKGLAASISIYLWILTWSFCSASTISSTFDNIVASRDGIGYPSPLPPYQLIQGSPGNDFVDSSGSSAGNPNLGGLGPALPYHQTVDALNSWAVRLYDNSNTLLPTPVLYLDLGTAQWTDGFIIWNSNAGDTAIDSGQPVLGGSGLKTARLSYANPAAGFNYSSTDPVDFAALSWTTINVSGSNLAGEFGLAMSTGLYSEPQVNTFDAISARLLRLELVEGFGYKSMITVDDGLGGSTSEPHEIIWLGEVAYYQASAPTPPDPLGPVPEPSTLVVFGGLAGLRLGRRLLRPAKK
jgi:hypothetical protein